MSGTIELYQQGGRVSAINGYSRELSHEEAKSLLAALKQKAPATSASPDAYVYTVRAEQGKRVRSLTLNDSSSHPLVPWLRKECAAILRAPSTH